MVAKLQLKFAVAARDENRYHILDEREVASSLQDWLKDGHSLPEETATEVAEKLAEKWRTGRIQIHQAPERYSGCIDLGPMGAGWGGGGSSGTVKNFQASRINPTTPMFVASVGLAAAGEASPAFSGDGEALVVGSSYSSWDIPAAQGSSQDIEDGDE